MLLGFDTVLSLGFFVLFLSILLVFVYRSGLAYCVLAVVFYLCI